MLYLILTHK